MRVCKLVYIPTRFRQNTSFATFIAHIDLNVHSLQMQADVKLIPLHIQITHCTDGENPRYLFNARPVDLSDSYILCHVYKFCKIKSFSYEMCKVGLQLHVKHELLKTNEKSELATASLLLACIREVPVLMSAGKLTILFFLCGFTQPPQPNDATLL
jgi:hypothetical protein